MKLRFPRFAYNKLTFSGAFMALVTGTMMLFFVLLRSGQTEANPYIGILVYMIIPPVLFLGLVLIPFGMWRQKRLQEKFGVEVPHLPVIDLNKTTHRNAAFVFVFGTVIFLLIVVVGGYQAFHFTESVEFCGTTCHTAMEPEHVAYQNSPHARVACVKCHVGPGAGWYARSKLSGAYQVYAVTRDIYPRPIPTPIHNLRPAADVCEQCHWPEKFYGGQQKRFEHYMYDEENTHWPITLLLKTGGGDPAIDSASGIHWHMNISVTLEYIARDHERQDIPWVRMTSKATGEVTVYQDQENPLTEEEVAAATPRVMDCVDCHNRPSHNYHAPDHLIDRAISSGRINAEIPEIKLAAVTAMAGDYENSGEAHATIRAEMMAFYTENYPEVLESDFDAVDGAIVATVEQYSRNMFPTMKVKWDVYPDNIGHFIFKGCMRCHGGNHENEDGETISRDCNSCHTILAQGSVDEFEMSPTLEGLVFKHPDGDDDWRDTGCYECHEGVDP